MERICKLCGEKVYVESGLPLHCYGCDSALTPKDVLTPWSMEARMNQLKAMHSLMCNVNDETIYLSWIQTMPDGATEDDFKDIALDDDLYNECFELFIALIKRDGNRW